MCRGLYTLFLLLPAVLAASYSLSDSYVGSDFFGEWDFEAIPDPTHGRVDYVDQLTAQHLNLSYASGNAFVMRADATTTLDPDGPGRRSVRIRSKKQYKSAVIIWDIRHMPEGCGTWPAAWTVGANWPHQGEVDVLEGVNNQQDNIATLHTSAGCTMPTFGRIQSGFPITQDCEGNNGCTVEDISSANSFGPDFNSNGGGVYAMERSSDGIRVWFWGRDDLSIPPEITSGSRDISTELWPIPFADFPSTQCDIESYFGPHWLVFDLTFCGDFAGNPDIYAQSGCPSTCTDYVNNHPSAFRNAFWDIASVKVFE